MVLKLYNTRTKRKEIFMPLDPERVRMYVCGPTVYDYAHIGNARPAIVFDVLFRLLRHLYGPDHVVYARNITDVDDKINARAAEEGIPIAELTARTTAQYHEDIRALGVLMPEEVNEPGKPPRFIEPRATAHIPEMISLIERLIERGHAYAAEGHVLFDVASDPNYGALARRSLDEMRAGARVEVAPYKRGPMDFVLWKPSEGGRPSSSEAIGATKEPGWESPWGYGRPGWHLECSAMAEKHLGDVFDIHGGGIDLLFPHHENEVAQSTCAHGTGIMANIWMHNGHLQVEGEKMSKSLGNFVTINDLLNDWKGVLREATGEVLRLNMLRTQYRQPMNWSAEGLSESITIYDGFVQGAKNGSREKAKVSPAVQAALEDDLNTPAAITELIALAKAARGIKSPADAANELVGSLDAFFGFTSLLSFVPETTGVGADLRAAFAKDRKERDAREAGIDIERVEALRAARLAARKAKNWAEADRIRDELAAMGVALKDAKNPETGEIETTWEIAR
jgi:cysteinyl-tRNA synthetase